MINAVLNPENDSTIGAHSDLLGLLLRDQQEMSAVERFSMRHDEQPSCQVQQYRSLLPATPLEEGEQYAFSVDLDRCSGCKACVTACHNLNGLDDHEAWRDVGLLYSASTELPMMQHVTAACHHCVNPACMNACPTNAYEKDPITGIVKHLDDQCFGCQYCTLACPYGVPKYHEKKGIVRKCDMCSQRLANDEAPACAQACPHEAIAITKVSVTEARSRATEGEFITGAHNPSYTTPTTVYKSRKPLPKNLLKGDQHDLTPEHAHLPLVLMLVLIQVSAGAFLFLQLARMLNPAAVVDPMLPFLTVGIFGVSQLALAASTVHLGRPLYAFRGILGIRHSWMSREIAAFGAYSAAAGTYAASFWVPEFLMPFQPLFQQYLGYAAVLTGYIGLACSIMIYECTQRRFWNGTATTMKFVGTSLCGGTALLMMLAPIVALVTGDASIREFAGTWSGRLAIAASALTLIKLLTDAGVLRHLTDATFTSRKKSARLILGPLRSITTGRAVCAALGIVLTTTLGVFEGSLPLMGTAALAAVSGSLILAGEFAERYLFFAAVDAPRMPGGLKS